MIYVRSDLIRRPARAAKPRPDRFAPFVVSCSTAHLSRFLLRGALLHSYRSIGYPCIIPPERLRPLDLVSEPF